MSQAPSALSPRLANNQSRRRALVSLTPLIDVVFILLVFFMLASSFLDWRAIDLTPPGEAAKTTATQSVSMLIDVTEDGLRLGGQAVELAVLLTQVQQELTDKADRPVVVRPQAGVSLQEVITLLDRLAAIGVTKLSLNRHKGGDDAL